MSKSMLTVLIVTGLLAAPAGVLASNEVEFDHIPVSPNVVHLSLPGDPDVPVRVIRRETHFPGAVVSKALSDQPTWPHKIEVQVVNTRIFMDPYAQHTRERLLRLPDDHSFVRAYRMWAALHPGTRTRVIHPQNVVRNEDALAARVITPRMIIQTPDRPGDGVAPPIPQVPVAPEKESETGKLVKADTD